jgi:hypothetical protein
VVGSKSFSRDFNSPEESSQWEVVSSQSTDNSQLSTHNSSGRAGDGVEPSGDHSCPMLFLIFRYGIEQVHKLLDHGFETIESR